jgi:hypothetical protein
MKLETDRQDNERQVAALCYSMAMMLMGLADLDETFKMEGKQKWNFQTFLDKAIDLIRGFGNFCDVYYRNISGGLKSLCKHILILGSVDLLCHIHL